MTIPLQITFQNMPPSPAIEANVRERSARLERFAKRIVSCKVVIESPHRHHHKGKLYDVSLEISVPGKDIHVTRSPRQDHAHEDVYVAIRDAFNAAGRQLEDHVRRLRADVKTHEAPDIGIVVRLFPEQGYGFIAHPRLGEIYFHEHSVVNGGFRNLSVGNEVRFTAAEGESPQGLQASTVTPIGKHHPQA
jgi:ribosomal subunit interface protein